MSNKNTGIMPSGYKPVKFNKLKDRLNNLSPAQLEIQSLMVRDKDIRNSKDRENASNPPYQKLKKISDIQSNNIEAQRALRELTPFIRRAEQIWLTLLLKPNGDMGNKSILSYSTVDSELKNDELHQLLLKRLENHFNTIYPYENRLSRIIKDVMFRVGSYVLVNISHPALDHIINGMDITGNESLLHISNLERYIIDKEFEGGLKGKVKNKGWISKHSTTESLSGFENLFKGNQNRLLGTEFNLVNDFFKWSFTDNPIILKMNELHNSISRRTLSSTSGLENMNGLIDAVFSEGKNHKTSTNNVGITDKEAYENLLARAFPDRKYDNKESFNIRKSQYYTANGHGTGTVDHPPSESCIPVHLNGNVDGDPIGFIFLIDDQTGRYIQSTNDNSYYKGSRTRKDKIDTGVRSGSMNSIIANLKNFAQGKDCDFDMDWTVDYVTALLEKELIESFANGAKGNRVTISLTDEQKRIYMSRALKQQGVRSVFVPAEYVTYFAIDYNAMGIGQSLVEEAKAIITRNVLLNVADTAAQIENSVSKSELRITPESEDFSPMETSLQVRENYLQTNPSMIDIVGFSSQPIDIIIDGVKNTMVQTVIDPGDNRRVIAPGIEVREIETGNLKGINDEARTNSKNEVSSFLDLKLSWLEDSENGNEFAIEALGDQQLLKDTVVERSTRFSLLSTDHLRKYIATNEPLMLELITTIKDNKKLYDNPDQNKKIWDEYKEEVKDDRAKVLYTLNDFLKCFRVSLPAIKTIESHNKITDKIDAVDKLVKTWVDTGVPENILKNAYKMAGIDGGDENVGVDITLDSIKSIMTLQACKLMGVPMPFDEIIGEGDSGGIMGFVNQISAVHRNTLKFIETYIESYIKDSKEFKKAVKATKTKLEGLESSEDEVDNDSSTDLDNSNNDNDLDNNDEEQEEENNSDEGNESTVEDDENNQDDAVDDLNQKLTF